MLEFGDFLWTHASYGLYLAISIGITVWVARVLAASGETFLMRCFGQDHELARSTSRLLVIGFYLVTIGLISYRLGGWQVDTVDLIPLVGARVGVTLLGLALTYFVHMLLLERLGRTVNLWARDNGPAAGPDVAPAGGA